MKNNLITAVVVGLLTTLGTYSCIKSTPVGSELFDNDKLNVQFTDTVTIRCLTEKTDSVAAYLPTAPSSTLFCGNTVDPTFGKQELMMFTQVVNVVTPNSMVGALYDSAVLVLPYDPALTQIDSSEIFQLDVHQLTQPMDSAQVLYSNKKYAYNSVPIGTQSFRPRLSDSLVNRVDSTLKTAQVVIRLNDQFAQRLVDTTQYPLSPVYAFKNAFKGLCIKANGTTKSVLAFNTASSYARLHVYFHRDTNKLRLDFLLSQTTAGTNITRYTYINQDYTNAPIEPYVRNQRKSDSLVFLQGLAGANVQLEIPYARNLGKIAVNKAELEFTINDKDGYKYPALEQLALYQVVSGAGLDFITDFNTASQNTTVQGYFPYFGGTPQVLGGSYVYRMNITDHLQQIIAGKQGSIMTLTAYNKTSKLNRAILYGAGTTGARRAKLRLTYTVL